MNKQRRRLSCFPCAGVQDDFTHLHKWLCLFTRTLTSGHDFNMDGVWEGSVPYRGEGQDLDGVGLWGDQVLDGGDHAILDIVDLPFVHRPRWVHGIVHTVPFYLQQRGRMKEKAWIWSLVCTNPLYDLLAQPYCSKSHNLWKSSYSGPDGPVDFSGSVFVGGHSHKVSSLASLRMLCS